MPPAALVHDAPLASSPPNARATMSTQRALAREQKLRADPMADVHGPFEVSCRRCGTHIKLSTKSTYDPFHWQRHIERCSKRPLTVLKQVREKGKYQRKSRSSVSKDMQAAESLRSSRSSRAKGKGKSAPVATPQLTPDDTDERVVVVKEEAEEEDTDWKRGRSRSRSSGLDDGDSLSSPPPKTPPPQRRRKLDSPEDVMFEEYLQRSQRRLTREFSPLAADSWRDWNWSQLKEPVWVADSHNAYHADDRRTTRPDLPESFERGFRPGDDASSSSSVCSHSRNSDRPLSP